MVFIAKITYKIKEKSILFNIYKTMFCDNIEQINEAANVFNTYMSTTKIDDLAISFIEGLSIFLDEPNFIPIMKGMLKKIVENTKEVGQKVVINSDYNTINDNDKDVYLQLYNSFLKLL